MNLENIDQRIYPYLNYIYHTMNSVNIKVPSYSLYHDTISLIISQRIPFKRSREIREDMMTLLSISGDERKFTYKFIHSTMSNVYKGLGISDKKYQVMKSIPDIPDVTFTIQEFENYLSYISNIPGIGPWTCNALRVINKIPGSYLSNDLYIQSNIEKLLALKPGRIRQTEVQYILNKFFSLNTLEFTILFWRLKKESIYKMIKFQELTDEDFY